MTKDGNNTIGSRTARSGFLNEDEIVAKFNNWKDDKDAQNWLTVMGYILNEIEKVEAIKLHGYKTDVQVLIKIYFKKTLACENLSVKLVSNEKGYNQIDKRWVDTYAQMWNMPNDVAILLKYYTGELLPEKGKYRDSRRVYLNEMSKEDREKILRFFEEKKILIVSDIFKGRDKFPANWMLVIMKSGVIKKWVLKPINYVMNFYGNGEVFITSKGNLRIGKITVQRKGGDCGERTSQMLQFKINPAELFNC